MTWLNSNDREHQLTEVAVKSPEGKVVFILTLRGGSVGVLNSSLGLNREQEHNDMTRQSWCTPARHWPFLAWVESEVLWPFVKIVWSPFPRKPSFPCHWHFGLCLFPSLAWDFWGNSIFLGPAFEWSHRQWELPCSCQNTYIISTFCLLGWFSETFAVFYSIISEKFVFILRRNLKGCGEEGVDWASSSDENGLCQCVLKTGQQCWHYYLSWTLVF